MPRSAKMRIFVLISKSLETKSTDFIKPKKRPQESRKALFYNGFGTDMIIVI